MRIIKHLGAFLIVIIIISVIGIFVRRDVVNKNNKAQVREQKQQEDTKEQYNMSFSFEGDKSQMIDLIKGKAVLSLVYHGNSKFTAKISNIDGTLLASLVDANGPYNGIHIVEVPETGSYIFDVRTSGDWSFSCK